MCQQFHSDRGSLQRYLRVISLAVENEEAGSEQNRYNENHPHIPPPAGSLGNKATANRTQDRAEQNSHAVHGDCLSALRGNEEVGDDTSADSQTSAATNASEETHGDETAKVRRERAAKCESAEDDVASVEDDATAVYLGEGGEEERAELKYMISEL